MCGNDAIFNLALMIPINNREDDLHLEKLREILLLEDRKRVDDLQKNIEDQLLELQQTFPKKYEETVNQLIEKKLKHSQEEIVNVIYPVLGKMIKRYVTLQIKTFKDAVDDRIKNTFTIKTFMQKMKASFFGMQESDMIFSDTKDYQVEEAYIIEKNSGLLVGIASKGATIDKDVLAGMLTAIKAFGEDALKVEQQDLSAISYDSYQIYLQSAHSYYIALVLSGPVSSNQEVELGDKILDFAGKHLQNINSQNRDKQVGKMSEYLHHSFIKG